MLNLQTKMRNSSAPPPLDNLFFVYGNPTLKLSYRMIFHIDLGANTYDSIQIGVFENCVTQGGEHGLIEVVEFGGGGFTGAGLLHLTFGNYFGAVNLGLRTERSAANESTIIQLQMVIMPVP